MSESSRRRESMIDSQIRTAQERGDFDNLPGAGKPLPQRWSPDDELWWVKDYVRREGLPTETLLPTSLRLAREIERLPDRVRTLGSERVVREVVAELNRQVVDYLRLPSGPYAPVRTVDPEELVRGWQAARAAASEPQTPAAAPEAAGGRRRGWRGWVHLRRIAG